MQSDDLFIRKIRRHCNRPPLSALSFEPKGTPTVTSIRTRVEWPPKKEPFYKGAGADKSKGQGPHLALRGSGARSYLMHRSNSDITIGDGEAEVEVDGVGASSLESPNSGDALHREYGSLTSIEKPGGSPRARAHSHEEHRSSSPAAQRFRDPFLLLGLPGDMQEVEVQFQILPQGSPVERNPRVLGRMNSLESTAGAKALKCDQESGLGPELLPKTWIKQLAHFDVQSILFDPREVVNHCNSVGQRKNITTGASAASQLHSSGASSSPSSSTEDLNSRESLTADEGDGKDSLLVLSCPFFRNEIGGEGEHSISRLEASQEPHWGSFEPPPACRSPNAAVSVLEEPRECFAKKGSKVGHSIEYADLGACYYRKYFYGKEHQNFFGMDEQLGPVAISVRREDKEGGSCLQYNYRIIFRTTELKTLRGSILEEAVPSAARHTTPRGLSPKKLLEHVIPELNLHCLRLASNSPKVPETLLKLDEQGLSFQRKIGIMYCKAGQSSEEEMYNNETAGPAFQEFLQLLGEEVQLKGFDKYRAQLDNKTDSTGTHSLYTTYQEYEIMFHVSTMLPYTANNRQQLLRKRHIGNDIVTIVFQEPGALPFTPKTIRSHFQHVFIIVQAHAPCMPHTTYSVAVSRTKDIPLFGPFIPEENLFPRSATFRDFLLAKAVNAENAAEKSEKFYAMATRTRQEYLRDLATNYVTTTTIESTSKFALISLGGKKKEKSKGAKGMEMQSAGALVWNVRAWDSRRALELKCLLGISAVFLVLIEGGDRRVIFNCSCRDVLAWTFSETSMDIYYEKGDYISMNVAEEQQEDIKEIVHRLQLVTRGCETRELTLLRNGVGQLGFQVDPEGFVTEVERFTFAEKAGLQPGARLVRVCGQPLVCLSPQRTAELLRTAKKVTITVVPPEENGKPRRSYSELYLKSLQEQNRRADPAPATAEGKTSAMLAGGAGLKPATLQFLRSLSLQDGPQITLVEERTEFLRRNSDRKTKRMEDRHSTCGEISAFSDATPDVIPKPLPERDLRMDIQDPPGNPEPEGLMCNFSSSQDPSGEDASAAVEPSETDKFLPRTLSLRNSITKFLSQNPEPLEEEWQCISNLALTCNSILEAMSKEGQQSSEAGDSPAVTGGKTPNQRKTKDEDVARTLSEKVCQLEAVLKRLQDDLQKEKKDKAVLEAEVQSLRQNNQRLQEESQTTVAQLIKVTEMLCSTGSKQL